MKHEEFPRWARDMGFTDVSWNCDEDAMAELVLSPAYKLVLWVNGVTEHYTVMAWDIGRDQVASEGHANDPDMARELCKIYQKRYRPRWYDRFFRRTHEPNHHLERRHST